MLRGVYTAASAMLAQETAQSVIANNLANVNTVGYKGDIAVFESFRLAALTRVNGGLRDAFTGSSEQVLGDLGGGSAPAGITLDRTEGSLKRTGNPLDVAARGNQFFVVRTPGGDRLTRAGAFTLGPDGTLTDTGGYPVVGRDGNLIRLDTHSAASIDAGGSVLVNGAVAAGLKVVELAPGARPVKEGSRLLRVDAAAYHDAARPALVTESLETSNVSVVEEMVGMIAAMRAYEAAQKAVQSEDETLGRALNDVAKA
jgi:flagellar basal-body rod protein FlgG